VAVGQRWGRVAAKDFWGDVDGQFIHQAEAEQFGDERPATFDQHRADARLVQGSEYCLQVNVFLPHGVDRCPGGFEASKHFRCSAPGGEKINLRRTGGQKSP
jgi:hypothetical protein